MKKITQTFTFLSLALIWLLAGCNPAPAPSPLVTIAPPLLQDPASPTSRPATGNPSATATVTPSPTPVPSATPTPTALVLALPGTPLPTQLAPITVNNAAQVSNLAALQEESLADLAWTPDGQTLVVARKDGISFYDPHKLQRFRSLYPKGQEVIDIAFSPDGAWLATASRRGSLETGFFSDIQLWSGPFWRPLGVFYEEPRALASVSFSPDGKLFASAYSGTQDQENMVEFRNTITWAITRTLYPGPVLDIHFSPDGKQLATTPDRYAIKVWNFQDAKKTSTMFTSFTGAVKSMAFSPKGNVLATGHYDGTIRLWNPSSGEEIRTMTGNGVVDSLAFDPSGTLLASGQSYETHTVLIWDVDTGDLLRSLEGHTHAVTQLLFSPDGQLLVSGSFDGDVRLWGIRP